MHFINESHFIEEGSKPLSSSSSTVLEALNLPTLVISGQKYFFPL